MLLRPHGPSDAATEHCSSQKGIPKMKLQASRPINPKNLQSQTSAQTKNRLATSRLGILHGRLTIKNGGARNNSGLLRRSGLWLTAGSNRHGGQGENAESFDGSRRHWPGAGLVAQALWLMSVMLRISDSCRTSRHF